MAAQEGGFEYPKSPSWYAGAFMKLIAGRLWAAAPCQKLVTSYCWYELQSQSFGIDEPGETTSTAGK
jgi:hypothetical protein